MIYKEEWLPVIGYEGFYEISNYGRLKSLQRKGVRSDRILSLCVSSEGYLVGALQVGGIKRSISAHQLVAESFLNHEPNGMSVVINHIDHNKLNNRVDNLELTDIRDNTSKGYLRKPTSSKYTGVYRHKGANKWMAYIYVNKVREYLGLYNTEESARKAYQSRLVEIQKGGVLS